MKTIIKQNKRKFNKYGIRKYAEIESFNEKNVSYTVGKVRVRNKKHYRYVCTCPDFFYRQTPCKHIKKFKELEK